MNEKMTELEDRVALGDKEAMMKLADALKWGLYGEVDLARAAALYRECAKSVVRKVSSAGFYNLGLFYYFGYLEEEPNERLAFDCFMKSALRFPNRAALGKLADMYRYGQYVEQNEKVALALYGSAARAS